MVEGDEDIVLTGVGVQMVTSSVLAAPHLQEHPEHPFQCLDCGKSFKWSSRLAHHQRSHNNERPYRCNLCPKAFKGSSALLYHQRSHSGEKPYKCDDCDKAFKRSSLLQVHRSVHTGLRTFQCPYCPLTFKWSSHYQYHLRQHTGECPYPCDSCPKAFKNSSSLRRHKNVHLGLKPYVCTVCTKAFTQSTNLRQHMRIHTGERPYICGECGRSFTHSSNLALHRNSQSHTGEGKGGETGGGNMGDEIREVIVGEDVTSQMLTDMGFVSQEATVGVGVGEVFLSVLLYSCGSCSQTFSTRTELEDHQAMHLGPGEEGGSEVVEGPGGEGGGGHLLADFEEVVETTAAAENGHTTAELLGPYRCSECGKAFKGSSGLRYHMRDHTGERPYRCTECGKSFKRSSLLSIHQRAVFSVRAFQCPYCPLTFKWSSHYQYHLRQHTGERPYVCQECGKSFKNSSCLRRHSQLHSGERPFQCAQCHKSFTHSSNLQLHLRTHSSRKDYKCPFCGKEFVMQSYLQRHMRTHGNGAVAGDAGVGGKEGGRGGKGGGGVTTTTTLLNPITLETTGNSGSLIVSQPALDIPPNTSQNYFMIQTANGLQLIPLSAPAPPPPPPPPPQTQYIILQCPSTNGSQPSLILVPTTTTNPQPTLEPQGLPLVQTVLNPAQTQMQHFQTISQQQQQPRFIITTNNNNVNNPPVAKTTTPSLNSMLNKPILGKSTRTARSRRGRKPKVAVGRNTTTSVATTTTSVTMTTAPVSQSGDVIHVSSCNVTSVTPATVTAANTMTSSLPSSLPAKSQSPFSPPTASVSVSTPSFSTSATVTSGPLKVATVNLVTTVTPASLPSDPVAWVGEPQTPPELGKTTEQDMKGEQYVLCFQKGGKKEEVKIGGEGGGSYVLQFEGEGSGEGGQGGMGREGDGESYVLRFQTEGEREGEREGGKEKGSLVSLNLLQEWGGVREGERRVGEDGGEGESFVLHFQTEPQSEERTTSDRSYPEGPSNSLELSCPPPQALMPLNGQEVVFELGDENKMVGQGSGESVQMIALIQGGEEGEGGSYSGAGGAVGEGRGAMEGIFQLEGGEGIVIIEVSASSLREGGMDRGEGGVTVERSEAKGGSGITERLEKDRNSAECIEIETGANEGENTATNGPTSNSQFS
uniref:C2H2-type domain-containing protein n=1 Tax=Hucho hucho TaxID=62062 RepID=A0A4W5LV86_9TELE